MNHLPLCTLVTVLIAAVAQPAVSGTVQLPATGQTTSYATGDDGDLPRGAAWPVPRFTENVNPVGAGPNGAITDNLTGLVWLKNANCTDTVGGIVKSAGTLNWQDALTWSNALGSGSCGLTDGSKPGDWRLPNRKELSSILNLQKGDNSAWLISQGFTGVQSLYYWSSSTYAGNTSDSWEVGIYSGDVNAGSKIYGSYVWPVRSGK